MSGYEKFLKQKGLAQENKEAIQERERMAKILLAKGRVPLGYFWQCPICEVRFPAFVQPSSIEGYTDKTVKRISKHIEKIHLADINEWEQELSFRQCVHKNQSINGKPKSDK